MALPFDVDANQGRPLARSGLPPGQLRMWRLGQDPVTDAWGVHCLLGAERPKIVRGYGGWGQVKRDGRRAVSAFDGSETPAYSIAVKIDNRRPIRQPVAETMRRLERLSGWDILDDTPPPVIQWVANVEHDYAGAPKTQWVIESLEWGDSLATDRATLLWQEATLTVAIFVDTRIPELGKAAAFPRRELKQGWDLRDFARKRLGDPKRWKDVAALNRDNPKCPTTPHFKPSRPVWLLVPPREPKRRGR